MLKDRDVVIILGVEWDSLWQGAQEMAARMGEASNRVLYVENIGIRAPVGDAVCRRGRAGRCYARAIY
jgi:hypothetical protein